MFLCLSFIRRGKVYYHEDKLPQTKTGYVISGFEFQHFCLKNVSLFSYLKPALFNEAVGH